MKSTLFGFIQKLSPAFLAIGIATLFFAISSLFTGDAMAGFGVDETLQLNDASGDTNLKTSLIAMLNYFLGFVGIVLIGIIVYAGFIIIVSQGDDEKLTEGRKMIIYALIGVVIIFLSFTIVNFIGNVVDNGQNGGGNIPG